MKKFAFLTSVLALAACGGGSGGGAGTPGAIVVPNANTEQPRMVGISNTDDARVANAVRAIRTTNTLISETNVDISATLKRKAAVNRMSKSPAINDIILTKEDVDAIYNKLSDILINGNIENTTYTNYDMLLVLALVLENEEEILGLLQYNDGDNLDDKIQNLITDLKESEANQTDEVKRVISSAREIYNDFGVSFHTRLEDKARFYHNSNDDYWYTFAFNENGELIGLKEKDETIIPKDKNNAFVKDHVKGYEYTFAFKGETFGGKVDKFYETKPSTEQLKSDLLTLVMLENSSWDEDTQAAVQEILNNAVIHSFMEEGEEEINNHIVGRRADYIEKIKIETGNKNLGLQYSDFGLKYEEAELQKEDDMIAFFGLDHYTYTEHNAFIGGYTDKIANPTEEMSFKGEAFAGLTRKQGDAAIESSNQILEPNNKYYRGTADFIVKTAANSSALEQKLVADFSKEGWYTVTVDNIPLNSHGGNISFENKSGKTIDAKWQADQANQRGELENMNIKYYGPESTNPTEVVGSIQYIENHNSNGDWTYKADITFGAKKE